MAEVKKFPSRPYFDDFNESNNFLRVLFRPGLSVQTRELNQMQTILQDQIGLAADYSIPNATAVVGGITNLNTKYEFIKLANGTQFGQLIDDYQGAKFVAQNGVEGNILFALPSQGSDPATLYVKYTKAGATSQVADNAQSITVTHLNLSIETLAAATLNATGYTAAVTLSPGIFYINKSFIRSDDQVLLLNKYDNQITQESISVGFIVKDEIIKPEQDLSLLDNASGSPNDSAPGAHRYKASIVLIKQDDVPISKSQDYVELMSIKFGKVAARPRIDSEFTTLEQILARRTYDESGDYIVDDFALDIREHLNTGSNGGVFTPAQGGSASKLALQLDSGKAYVRGFEVDARGDTYLEINKARTTQTQPSAIVQTQYAAAFFVYANSPATFLAAPILNAKINLRDSTNAIIGNAFIRGFEYEKTVVISSSNVKLYRLDVIAIEFVSGKSWSNVATIVYGTGVNTVQPNAPFDARVHSFEVDGKEQATVYALPYEYVSTITPRVSQVYKEFSGVVSNGTTIVLNTNSANITFDDELDSFYFYINHSGGKSGIFTTPGSIVFNQTRTTATISNLTEIAGTANVGNVAFKVIAKVFKSQPQFRTKSINSQTDTFANSLRMLRLSQADVFKVNTITANGVNVTNKYIVDNGQRDSYYDFGSITLKSGESLPAGPIVVNYQYFTHLATGDFFTPDSYTSAVAYEQIPTFKSSTGKFIFLGSAVDYRKKVVTAGGVTQLDPNGDTHFVTDEQLTTDITYYIPRSDRVCLTKNGEFVAIQGTPAPIPELPNEIDDSITLYTLNIPAYTFQTDDIAVNKVKHDRFTMKDISGIKNRVETIEKITLLNSLEQNIQSKDFAGKFKTGFVVDNFASQLGADVNDITHNIAYDIANKEIRPTNITTNIDLAKVTQTGITTHGDTGLSTLSYTEVPVISQTLASGVIRLQPYTLSDWIGSVSLTPSSDIWFDSTNSIDTKLDQSSFFSQRYIFDRGTLYPSYLIGTVWDFVNGVWTNANTRKVATDRERQDLQNAINRAPKRNQQVTSNVVQTSSVTTTNTSAIPFIRARTINIRAGGFKPGVRLYPFFDGVDVSQFCGTTEATIGQPIIASSAGAVNGVFKLPAGMFRTGNREFILSDNQTQPLQYRSSIGRTTYNAQGTLTQNNTTVLATRTGQQSFNVYDPVAQSFFITPDFAEGGLFVSSIDLFFGPGINPTTNEFDVTVDIREMVNGYPGPTILPNGTSTVSSALIVGSADASTKVTFDFPAPVYLTDNNEYCFVVSSQSETITVWLSELGAQAFRPGDAAIPTGQKISKQPYLGSLFKSQNNLTWTPEQTQDLKFVINRCRFVSSGSITYTNTVPTADRLTSSDEYSRVLNNNPLNFTVGTNSIFVNDYAHGFKIGDSVVISGPAGTYNGIPSAEIFGTKTVTDVTVYGYFISSTTSATSTGSGGGIGVRVNRFVDYSSVQLLTDNIALAGTNVSYTLTGKNKETNASFTSPISVGKKIDLDFQGVAKTYNDQGAGLQLALTTSKNNLSPIIDDFRTSLVVQKNVVNFEDDLGDTSVRVLTLSSVTGTFRIGEQVTATSPSGTGLVLRVDQNSISVEVSSGSFNTGSIITSSGGASATISASVLSTIKTDKSTAVARYVQNTVTLINPANEINMFVDGNLPFGTFMKVYYKVGQADINEQGDWIEMPSDGSLVFSDDPNVFLEQKFRLEGVGDFFVYKLKIILMSSNPTKVPRLKNFRSIALYE